MMLQLLNEAFVMKFLLIKFWSMLRRTVGRQTDRQANVHACTRYSVHMYAFVFKSEKMAVLSQAYSSELISLEKTVTSLLTFNPEMCLADCKSV